MVDLPILTADLRDKTPVVKRQNIATCRALLALSVLMIFLFWGAYQLIEPTVIDPLWGRALFALVPASGLAASYLSRTARRRFIYLWRGFLYLTVTWFTGLSALNHFAPAYSLGLFFVVAATSAAFGVGLRRERSFLPFLGFSVLVPGGAALWTSVWGETQVAGLPILLVGLICLGAISYLILGWRAEVEQALEKRREEAKAASRLKSTIIGNMSHELRTPLTSILGFAEALEDELTGPEGEMASSIHKSGRRLKQTLEVLLDLSRLEAGSLKRGHPESGSLEAGKAGFEPEWIDVRRQVEKIASSYRPRAEEKGLDLEVRVPEGREAVSRKESSPDASPLEPSPKASPETSPREGKRATQAPSQRVSPNTGLEGSQKSSIEASSLEAHLNPDLFGRITSALLDNAIKFTEEGRVAVSIGASEEQVLLTVTDSGVGMEAPDRLFEPFRQGSEGIDREHEGLGLGLSLTGQIVEMLGGHLEIESEPSEGTQVEVRLPRFQTGEAP